MHSTTDTRTQLCSLLQMLRGLLYPLEFHHTYVPFLPDQHFEWIQSPTPLLAGLHSSMQREALGGVSETGTAQPVVVNLDMGTVSFPDEKSLPRCPSHIVHKYEAAINQAKVCTCAVNSSLSLSRSLPLCACVSIFS